MVIAFQIMLLLFMFDSFTNFEKAKGYKGMQEKTLAIYLASLVAFIVSVLWL